MAAGLSGTPPSGREQQPAGNDAADESNRLESDARPGEGETDDSRRADRAAVLVKERLAKHRAERDEVGTDDERDPGDSGLWRIEGAVEDRQPRRQGGDLGRDNQPVGASRACGRGPTAADGAVSDPAIVELRDTGNRHRREGLRDLICELAEAGALSAALTERVALDRAWMLTGVELYLNATNGCGWSDEDYEHWLAALLQDQLVGRSA